MCAHNPVPPSLAHNGWVMHTHKDVALLRGTACLSLVPTALLAEFATSGKTDCLPQQATHTWCPVTPPPSLTHYTVTGLSTPAAFTCPPRITQHPEAIEDCHKPAVLRCSRLLKKTLTDNPANPQHPCLDTQTQGLECPCIAFARALRGRNKQLLGVLRSLNH